MKGRRLMQGQISHNKRKWGHAPGQRGMSHKSAPAATATDYGAGATTPAAGALQRREAA